MRDRRLWILLLLSVVLLACTVTIPLPAPPPAPTATTAAPPGGAPAEGTPTTGADFAARYYAVPCRASGDIQVDAQGQCFVSLDDVTGLLAQAGISREQAQQYAQMLTLGEPETVQVTDDHGQVHDGIRRRVLISGAADTGRVVYVVDGLILVDKPQS